MFKTIKYISALTVAGISLAACSDGIITNSEDNTISSTGEKTPLEIAITLQDSNTGTKTRAIDGEFEEGDQLIAYVQQVEASDASISSSTFTEKISQLVTWNLSQKAIEDADKSNNQMTVTSDNKDGKLGMTLYWDDFSNSTDDIRGEKRFLRVGYGYCYNGGTPSPALTENTGILGWSVQADQTNASDEKKSDLLWASATVPFNADNYVKYEHVVNSRKPLPVTYRHAMSKVTIELVLDEGFKKTLSNKAEAFGTNNTTPTLYANKVATEVDAINQTIKTTEIADTTSAKISMRLVDDETTTAMHRVYEAIIAPTVMKAGNVLASVWVDGNKYELNLTDELLKTVYPAESDHATWASQLYGYTSSEENETTTVTKKNPEESQKDATSPDGITQSGVNYRLVATLKKQRIEVQAMILPWNDVYASTTGKISFNADVKESAVDESSLTKLTSGSFDLWRATANNAETDYDYVTSTSDVIDKASTYEYNTTTKKWEATSGNDVLYWDNATTSYYFRALAKVTSSDSDGNVTGIASVDGSTAVLQSTDPAVPTVDLLWAQTSEHKAKDANGNYFIDETDPSKHKLYEAGAAINPRTGDVPLTFEHAMSKISVVLETSSVATEKVELTGATISIINLYNGGTIGVRDGLVTELTAPNPVNGEDPMTVKGIAHTAMKDFLVVPQSLVYLKDGTTERTTTPIFYSADELTAIYPTANIEYDGSQNTSIGTGTPSYYLTRELTAVPAVYYADTEADKTIIYTFNKTLDGHKVKDDIEIPEVTQENYDYNGFITDQHHKTFTTEQFTALQNDNPNAIVKIKHQDATYYETLEDFHTYINNDTKYLALPAAFRAKEYYADYNEYNTAHGSNPELSEEEFYNLPNEQKIKGYYTYAEFSSAAGDVYNLFTTRLNDNTILPEIEKQKTPEVQKVLYTYDEYINLNKIEQDMFDALPADLKIKIPHADAVFYTEETANAYNLTLPGAKHVGDIKIPAHYALPSEGTLTPHNAGDLSVVGNKIVMYIFLKDGTRYSAELSTCLDTTGTTETNPNFGKPVTQWKRNEHYTYTITLTKEKIFFRALVKDWEKKTVGGNATLDWD